MPDIGRADVEVSDSDGKDDFTEGVSYDEALEKAKGAYDSLEELRESRKELSFWDKAKLTWNGETQAGRIAGTVLDVAEIFLPGWAVKTRHTLQSNQTTDTMGQEDNALIDILKRVLTTSNGGFWRLWDRLKGRDLRYYIAFALRALIALGLYYGANYVGLPIGDLLSIF